MTSGGPARPADPPPLAPADRGGLIILSLATLGPLAALAVWVRLVVTGAWDIELLAALHMPDSGLLRQLIELVNAIGNLAPWAIVVFGLALLAYVRRLYQQALLIALSFASDLAAFAVKLLVERDRPESDLVDQLVGADNFAFPSGHVVRATALAAVLGWVLTPRRWRLVAAIAAGGLAGLAMGYARVALGVHWPTDALGGILLGLGWFAVTTLAVSSWLRTRLLRSASETAEDR